MADKKYTFVDNQPHKKLQEGINLAADVVKLTLGPAGKNILLPKSEYGPPKSTRDGVTVANGIQLLKDPVANYGAQLVKEAARDANSKAGDGTTTATVLAQAIFNEGLKYVANGHNQVQIKRSIDDAVEKIVDKLKELAIPADTENTLINIATISANNDKELGSLIGEAVYVVEKKGTILVEDSLINKTHMLTEEGMKIDRGWGECGPYFLQKQSSRIIEMDNPLIAVIDDNIHTYEPLIPILAHCAKDKRNLLLIVRDLEDTILKFLVLNKREVGLPIAIIKTPGYNNSELVDDLCARIGGRSFSPSINPAGVFEPVYFGGAKRVVIRELDTTILGGNGNIAERLVSLNEALAEEENPIKKGRLQDRINRLSGSVATLKVAAESEIELHDKKLRIEDAICATKAAQEEGIVDGGGITFLKIRPTGDTIGEKIMAKALEEPIRNIISNAGENADKIIAQIEAKSYTIGYDAYNKTMADMKASGIIDPVKVTRTAIQKAASVSGMLLCTGSVVYME